MSSKSSRTPDSIWFRDQTSTKWSAKSDDSDPSFESDEENIDMETDCVMDTKNWSGTNSQRPKFVLKTPLLSSVMASNAQPKSPQCDSRYTLSGASSKSLVVGRPMRAIGLKNIDLTKNARAEEIRRAKVANRCLDNRQIINPISKYSSLSPTYPKTKEKGTPSGYHRNIYGINNVGIDDVIPNTPPPEYSTLALPYNKSLPDVTVDGKKSKVMTTKSQRSRLMLYSEFIVDDDVKCERKLENTDQKDVIEIVDDEDNDSITASFYEDCNSTLDDKLSCRQRHIENKPTCKESSLKYFSDDEDDDDKMKDTKAPVDKSLQNENQRKRTLFSMVGLFIVLVIIYYFNPLGMCPESEFQVNLTGLEEGLKQEFYGQHLARRVLLSSLKSHIQGKRNKPLVLSLHGWTGTGKNYVSGIIAKHLFKHGAQSSFIHKFIVPLHFPHVADVKLYRQQLREWIIGNATKCNKGGLFIFDEMDKIPDGLVSILKPFLDTRGLKSSLNLNQFVFLFLSNSGGQLINKYVLEHYKQGYARDTIDLVSLEGLLHRYAETNPSAWYNELMKTEVIDYFVPFLPLERSHVKQCVHRDMKTKGYIVLKKMVTEVMDEMSYFPQDLQLFSVSGCKKVSSKVDVAMG